MKISAVIPARYGSTRFEGKPLADILGKPMIQHVYEGVCQSKLIDEVIIATDDQRILERVKSFGGKVVMTSPTHFSGTDRVAEVARKLKSEIIVNVQGDEPLIKGIIIDKAIRPLLTDNTLPMSTLMTRIEEVRDWLNPHIVKVVADQMNFALYFSRSLNSLSPGAPNRTVRIPPLWDKQASSKKSLQTHRHLCIPSEIPIKFF